jgi:uncharacterized membrane protein YkoI
MKTVLPVFAVLGLSFAVVAPTAFAAAKEKPAHEKSTPVGSIRPRGNPKATERAALAKISYQDAMKVALAAVPGQVVYGELEVEDGNLQFDFQIITANQKPMDVGIDAGTGKVLSVDEGDDE